MNVRIAYNHRRRGALLFYALILLAGFAAAVVVLADACASLAFDTRQVLADARARNLHASGEAWAQKNVMPSAPAAVARRELDCSSLRVGTGASLLVAATPLSGSVNIEIIASCRDGKLLARQHSSEPVNAK